MGAGSQTFWRWDKEGSHKTCFLSGSEVTPRTTRPALLYHSHMCDSALNLSVWPLSSHVVTQHVEWSVCGLAAVLWKSGQHSRNKKKRDKNQSERKHSASLKGNSQANNMVGGREKLTWADSAFKKNKTTEPYHMGKHAWKQPGKWMSE